jgi:hypothetical protein
MRYRRRSALQPSCGGIDTRFATPEHGGIADNPPNEKRFTDRIETVTVDSVFAWLNRSGLGGNVQVIR